MSHDYRTSRIGTVELYFFVAVFLLIFLRCFTFDFQSNEYDVLPSIYKFVNPEWLVNDWYLNLSVGYRNLFNAIFGHFVTWFGFETASYIIRLLLYFLFTLAFCFLARTLDTRYQLATIVLAAFLGEQSLVAGEWILGGVETKTMAYTCALFSLAFLLRKQYRMGMLFAGFAFSFHVLIGLYAVFCIAFPMLLISEFRKDFLYILKNCWVFLLSGINGILFCLRQLNEIGDTGSQAAWLSYVQFRVPHHVLPSAWHEREYFLWLAVFGALAVFTLLKNRQRVPMFLAWHIIGCIALMGIGALVFILGDITLMRYYFFRYSDSMLPLTGYFLAAMTVQYYLASGQAIQIQPLAKLADHFRSQQSTVYLAVIALFFVIFASGFKTTLQKPGIDHQAIEARQGAAQWIFSKTPENTVVLTDPYNYEFYIEAQRSTFVSFKHVPQSSSDVVEWVNRLEQLNNGKLPNKKGFHARKELNRNYQALTAEKIQSLSKQYGISYFVTASDKEYPFALVYSNEHLKIYRL